MVWACNMYAHSCARASVQVCVRACMQAVYTACSAHAHTGTLDRHEMRTALEMTGLNSTEVFAALEAMRTDRLSFAQFSELMGVPSPNLPSPSAPRVTPSCPEAESLISHSPSPPNALIDMLFARGNDQNASSPTTRSPSPKIRRGILADFDGVEIVRSTEEVPVLSPPSEHLSRPGTPFSRPGTPEISTSTRTADPSKQLPADLSHCLTSQPLTPRSLLPRSLTPGFLPSPPLTPQSLPPRSPTPGSLPSRALTPCARRPNPGPILGTSHQ